MPTSIDVRFPSLVVNCYLKNICRPLNIPLYPELSANSGFLVVQSQSLRIAVVILWVVLIVFLLYLRKGLAISSLKVRNCFNIFYQNNGAKDRQPFPQGYLLPSLFLVISCIIYDMLPRYRKRLPNLFNAGWF